MLSQQKIIQNERSFREEKDEFIFDEGSEKPLLYCHDIANTDNTLSFMFGVTFGILVSSNHEWLFSMAAWGFVLKELLPGWSGQFSNLHFIIHLL